MEVSIEDVRRLIFNLCRRPISFNPIFVDLPGGSINAALFLSQALYWTERTTVEVDGWFYKTREEWVQETRLSRREQEGARQTLRNSGVLEERLTGAPARLHFRINCHALFAHLSQLDGAKPPNLQAPNVPTSRAETAQLYMEAESTSESTTESTSKTPPSQVVVALPIWLPEENWKAFLEMRKSIRKKPTDRACDLLIKKLNTLRLAGNDPAEVLDQSTMNNWQNIYALKETSNGQQLNRAEQRQQRNRQVIIQGVFNQKS